MPIKITLEKKRIIRNSDNVTLIDACEQALTSASGVELKNKEARTGFIPGRLLPLCEFLTSKPQGASVVVLEPQRLEMDMVAWILLREYINFLNKLLIEEGSGSHETEVAELKSPYAVIRELLYQLVARILSNDTKEDGNSAPGAEKDKLLTAMTTFIEHPAISELCTTSSFFKGKQTTNFLIDLRKRNGVWFQRFTEMLNRNNLMHLNQRVIATSINALRRIESTIQAHLIVCLDPSQPDTAYTESWLDTTLKNCENKYLLTKNSQSVQNTDEEQIRLQEEKIILTKLTAGTIMSKEDYNIAVTNRAATLYQLFRETLRLEQLLAHMDTIIIQTGWIAVLVDIFNFSELGKLINQHYTHFKSVTETFPAPLKDLEKKPGLAKYPTAGLDRMMINTISGLQHLQSVEIKQYIKHSLFLNMASLVQLQQEHYSQFSFINIAALKNNGLLAKNISNTDTDRKTIATAGKSVSQTRASTGALIESINAALGDPATDDKTKRQLEQLAGNLLAEKAALVTSAASSPILSRGGIPATSSGTSSTNTNNNNNNNNNKK